MRTDTHYRFYNETFHNLSAAKFLQLYFSAAFNLYHPIYKVEVSYVGEQEVGRREEKLE